MIIGIILHVLFGAFMSAMLWFFGLGGMRAWFNGGATNWLGSPTGGLTVILAGSIFGYASYVFRDHDLIERSAENAERFRKAKLALFLIIPLFTGLLMVMLIK